MPHIPPQKLIRPDVADGSKPEKLNASKRFQLDTCVYRKLKSEHSGGAVHPRSRANLGRYIASPRTCAKRSSPRMRTMSPCSTFDGVLGHLGLLETVRRRSPRQDHSDRRTSNANLEPAWTTEEREIGRHLP